MQQLILHCLSTQCTTLHHAGRLATCLGDYGADTSDAAVQTLGKAISQSIAQWATNAHSSSSSISNISSQDTAQSVLNDWRQWVDWSEALELRDSGKKVLPIGVNDDGTLRVKDEATGREEILAAEYLM
jgi:hypothetical protein